MHALFAKIWPNKVVRWCRNGAFLAILWVLHFQRSTCSTFQTCILNSHEGHIMCGSMVDIQTATLEIRRGKKERKKNKPKDTNIMSASLLHRAAIKRYV